MDKKGGMSCWPSIYREIRNNVVAQVPYTTEEVKEQIIDAMPDIIKLYTIGVSQKEIEDAIVEVIMWAENYPIEARLKWATFRNRHIEGYLERMQK